MASGSSIGSSSPSPPMPSYLKGAPTGFHILRYLSRWASNSASGAQETAPPASTAVVGSHASGSLVKACARLAPASMPSATHAFHAALDSARASASARLTSASIASRASSAAAAHSEKKRAGTSRQWRRGATPPPSLVMALSMSVAMRATAAWWASTPSAGWPPGASVARDPMMSTMAEWHLAMSAGGLLLRRSAAKSTSAWSALGSRVGGGPSSTSAGSSSSWSPSPRGTSTCWVPRGHGGCVGRWPQSAAPPSAAAAPMRMSSPSTLLNQVRAAALGYACLGVVSGTTDRQTRRGNLERSPNFLTSLPEYCTSSCSARSAHLAYALSMNSWASGEPALAAASAASAASTAVAGSGGGGMGPKTLSLSSAGGLRMCRARSAVTRGLNSRATGTWPLLPVPSTVCTRSTAAAKVSVTTK